MEELKLFNNPEFGTIRVISIEDEPWLVGKDVAAALGYTDTDQALRRHVDDEDKLTRNFDGSGKNRGMTIINESGLYSLVLSSKLPTARKFRRWVTSEVLPSIRKTGGYIQGQQELSPEELMAKALLVAHKTLEDREKRIADLSSQNEIMKPKADYFDRLVDRNTLTNFRETAKQFGVAPKKFVAFLIENNFVYRDKRGRLLPAEGKNDGLFEVKECINDKNKWSGTQTLITPKGREVLRLLLNK